MFSMLFSSRRRRQHLAKHNAARTLSAECNKNIQTKVKKKKKNRHEHAHTKVYLMERKAKHSNICNNKYANSKLCWFRRSTSWFSSSSSAAFFLLYVAEVTLLLFNGDRYETGLIKSLLVIANHTHRAISPTIKTNCMYTSARIVRHPWRFALYKMYNT